MIELISFIKSYDGYSIRGTKTEYKRFYDEREWRFVPQIILGTDLPPRLDNEDFNDPIKKAHANLKLSQKIRLPFEPQDIKYIIVSKESEILPMINALKEIKRKYKEDIVKVLSSKIISAEQIRSDF